MRGKNSAEGRARPMCGPVFGPMAGNAHLRDDNEHSKDTASRALLLGATDGGRDSSPKP